MDNNVEITLTMDNLGRVEDILCDTIGTQRDAPQGNTRITAGVLLTDQALDRIAGVIERLAADNHDPRILDLFDHIMDAQLGTALTLNALETRAANAEQAPVTTWLPLCKALEAASAVAGVGCDTTITIGARIPEDHYVPATIIDTIGDLINSYTDDHEALFVTIDGALSGRAVVSVQSDHTELGAAVVPYQQIHGSMSNAA